MNEFFRLRKFLNYQWRAKTKYYLHSPFVFRFYLHVLEGTPEKPLQTIQILRKKLGADHTLIEMEDMGTGKLFKRRISDIEKHVAVRHKYGIALYRLVKYFHPKSILELGTSIGISSSYLALANAEANVTSIDGDQNLIELAKQTHRSLSVKNVETTCGSFENKLTEVLGNIPVLDLVFFDGNHTKPATLQYFRICLGKADENSIFIFDDIYRSREMAEAWEEIKADKRVTLTIDIFQMGIAFFIAEKLAKENFVLRY